MAEALTPEQVEHVAKLARLRLDSDQLDQFRSELTTILEHVARIAEVDVADVEPMTHPLSLSNRLAADEPGPVMPLADLLRNAPAAEGDFLAVPKVLGDDGGGA